MDRVNFFSLRRVLVTGVMLLSIGWLLVGIVDVSNSMVTHTMGKTVSFLMYPFLCVQRYLLHMVSNHVEFAQDNDQHRVQLQHLIEERDRLREENILLHATFSYYEDIHEVVAFKQRYDTPNSIVTQVLARTLTSAGHSMLIDAGMAQGVTEHMVAVYKNCIVGVVEQVYPLYSKVRLITDKRCKIAVYGAASRAHGIYEGINDLKEGRVNYMSHLVSLVKDELLLSSGQGLIFPQGFGVARLVSYEQDNLYYKVSAEPLADVDTIKCCILLPPKEVQRTDVEHQ